MLTLGEGHLAGIKTCHAGVLLTQVGLALQKSDMSANNDQTFVVDPKGLVLTYTRDESCAVENYESLLFIILFY